MPSDIDAAMAELKKQPGKHYRLVRLEAGNVATKKLRGYEPVRSEDPSVKGTILVKDLGPDGTVRVGRLALMQCRKEDHDKYMKEVHERDQLKLDMIQKRYKESEEDVKRQLGKAHKGYSHFVKEEE